MNIFPKEPLSIGGHFSRFIARLAESEDPLLSFAARLAAEAVRNGHVCLDLAQTNRFSLIDDAPAPLEAPDLQTWIEALQKTTVVGKDGDYCPLILDQTRLYLYAYWDYEQSLVDILSARASRFRAPENPTRFASLLTSYFPVPDAQAVACCIAGLKKFLVLSGGPGTGKTTSVAKIAAFLAEYGTIGQNRIALTAPTGKAAARLLQSFTQACAKSATALTIQNALPRQAFTIHRLLGVAPGSPYYKYNAENLLPYDILIIDEASMVDLALLTNLLSAVAPETTVIMVGDMDQLASVDAGAVLGDICDSGATHGYTPEFANLVATLLPSMSLPSNPDESAIADTIVDLKKNYRFSEHSGIGQTGAALKKGNASQAWDIVENGGCGDIHRRPLPPAASLYRELHDVIVERYSPYLTETDPATALRLFNSFRVLCALKNGPYGVAGINELIEAILTDSGILRPFSRWYQGRPVMITANDYRLGLFNGDCGVTAKDPASDSELKVFFPGDSTEEIRSFSPSRLPLHETVFAMTVHKAQGSEFDNVLFLAPPVFSPVLSRELLYTAITRARLECSLWCSREIFLKTAENRTIRMSGLREKLWNK